MKPRKRPFIPDSDGSDSKKTTLARVQTQKARTLKLEQNDDSKVVNRNEKKYLAPNLAQARSEYKDGAHSLEEEMMMMMMMMMMMI